MLRNNSVLGLTVNRNAYGVKKLQALTIGKRQTSRGAQFQQFRSFWQPIKDTPASCRPVNTSQYENISFLPACDNVRS
jgi:hypothetical protein